MKQFAGRFFCELIFNSHFVGFVKLLISDIVNSTICPHPSHVNYIVCIYTIVHLTFLCPQGTKRGKSTVSPRLAQNIAELKISAVGFIYSAHTHSKPGSNHFLFKSSTFAFWLSVQNITDSTWIYER